MKVKLIQSTQNPIDTMWVAARTCYSEQSPIELWDESTFTPTDKKWKLVKTVLDSGHQSIAEHVYFTFVIEGISRACSHQLVRHRAGIVFSQQSQRYVEIKEDIELLQGKNFTSDTYKQATKVIEVLDKYFVWDHDSYPQFFDLIQALYCYLHLIQTGAKAEDARALLPNATKTNITMSINYRELIHICNLRLCTRAQKEIRDLFKLIAEEVKKKDENLALLLVPTCEVNGFCKEHKCCGRKPQIKAVMESYEKSKCK